MIGFLRTPVRKQPIIALYFESDIKKIYSTQLSMKFILLINIKMPTIDGILKFISRMYTVYESFKARHILYFSAFYL